MRDIQVQKRTRRDIQGQGHDLVMTEGGTDKDKEGPTGTRSGVVTW